MCDLQWDVLAEIYLKKEDWPEEIRCLCSRLFTKGKRRKKATDQSGALDDDTKNGDEPNTGDGDVNAEKSIYAKVESEQETVSCYCSASHTDTLSTDEHDSLRDTHETPFIKQSDSGADLSEHSKHDIEADWHKYWSQNGEKLIWESWIEKYSAYINPEYLQGQTASEEKSQVSDQPKVTQTKTSKFTFDDKDIQNNDKDSRFDCNKKDDSKHSVLVRNLSGSEEKLFTEVSEGWNPLSPLSVEGETEAERLLSSRCGSHASGSVKTIDSMTNVTRMTVSSIDLSSSASSSDSFSSVSSVNSSVCSDDLDEEYQSQWSVLWKKHYEDEYYIQYVNFIRSVAGSTDSESTEKHNQTIEHTALKNQALNSLLTNKSRLHKENADSNKSIYTNSESETIKSLGQLNLNSSNEEALVSDDSDDYDIDKEQNAEMTALGLPLSFLGPSIKKDTQTKKNILSRSDSFNAGRNRIRAAFNLLCLEYQDEADPCTGQVDYKMKHIRLQNRHLQFYVKPNKHTFFDDDGNVIATQTNPEEEIVCPQESEDSEEYWSTEEEEVVPIEATVSVAADSVDGLQVPKRKRKKKKRKINLPPEIKENSNLRKYWQRRFNLFSKFDQGIRLDEESWYSVTPEQIAKFTAERCKCDVIIDAFCGAGGNSIQFAMVCERVISFDIDPKKIEMAKHNAAIYGVADKIEFIVGDCLKLAPTLKADVVFASPPWGGPNYINQPVYEVETMLQPVPMSQLLAIMRKVTPNVGLFLPKNSNTVSIIKEAGPGGKVEIQQEFLNNQLIAISVFYGNLVKDNQ